MVQRKLKKKQWNIYNMVNTLEHLNYYLIFYFFPWNKESIIRVAYQFCFLHLYNKLWVCCTSKFVCSGRCEEGHRLCGSVQSMVPAFNYYSTPCFSLLLHIYFFTISTSPHLFTPPFLQNSQHGPPLLSLLL